MCGRYVLVLRPTEIQRYMVDAGLQVDTIPSNDDVRQSYNIAPGYNEPVYRAELPESRLPTDPASQVQESTTGADRTRYIIQSMKWGLVPSWSIHTPDYHTAMKTINCRDDSLARKSGLWSTIKHQKRCIIPAEGFYEWLKQVGGVHKQPHYIKRTDGQLLFLAGLWDCYHVEGSQPVYTYTIVTTSSNPQLSFLHDRMPVILDPVGVKRWLHPATSVWNEELQSLLKPFEGELTVYPVTREVGKVGNNSPNFILPVKDRNDGIKRFLTRQKEIAITPNLKDVAKDDENGDGIDKRKANTEEDEGLSKMRKIDQQAGSAISTNKSQKKKSAGISIGGDRKITSFFANAHNNV